MEFKPSAWGLHYHDVSDASSNIELMLVNTVRENFEGYTRHKVTKAREARRIQGMIANLTKREFAGMVREQLLTNCPVTVWDVDNANQFFGPKLTNLRGNTTRTKPERVRVEYVQIPQDLYWDSGQLAPPSQIWTVRCRRTGLHQPSGILTRGARVLVHG